MAPSTEWTERPIRASGPTTRAAKNRSISSGRIGVGYRVNVRILTASKPKALLVPRAALFRGLDGRWEVYAIEEGRVERREVAVGLMNDELAEIRALIDRIESERG